MRDDYDTAEFWADVLQGCGENGLTTDALHQNELEVLNYFRERLWVYETSSLDDLAKNVNASPMLTVWSKDGGYPRYVFDGLSGLRRRGLLDYRPEPGKNNGLWLLGPPQRLAKRVRIELRSTALAVFREFRAKCLADFEANKRMVVVDGIAKDDGDKDIERSLQAVIDGDHVRWMTFHGLSAGFDRIFRDKAEQTRFKLDVLLLDHKASNRLRENSDEKSFQTGIADGLKRLRKLRDDYKGRVKVTIKQYGRKWEDGFVRGMIVLDPSGRIKRASMVTMRWPSGRGPGGRGTEGLRMVCHMENDRVASLAHWFNNYFKLAWRRNHILLRNIDNLPIQIVIGLSGLAGIALAPFVTPSPWAEVSAGVGSALFGIGVTLFAQKIPSP